MPPAVFQIFLRRLDYSPEKDAVVDNNTNTPNTPTPAANTNDQPPQPVSRIWRSIHTWLPFITLPHRFRLNWSISPDTPMPNTGDCVNFPTLKYWRPAELYYYRKGKGIMAKEVLTEESTSGSSSSAASSLLTSLLPSEIDLSLLDLPFRVQVNSAFERLFGYTQTEIKLMFTREGKHAVFRLMDTQTLRQIHGHDLKGVVEGTTEFVHYILIHTKYGSGMKTLLHHTLEVNQQNQVCKVIYTFIPLPINNPMTTTTTNNNNTIQR